MQPQSITIDVLLEKYAKGNEKTVYDIYRRVAAGVASVEKEELRVIWENRFYNNMLHGAIGAGRIMSAAGANIDSSLLNCFVQPVGDSIQGEDNDGYPGIYEALRESAETMKRGGGVGYNFSKIRPKNAVVGNVGAMASGPCSYMDIFDASCRTIESAGARRGAQMGVLNIDHPDVEEFIVAKRTPGRWNNFNVSVFVTDAFMKAKNYDTSVDLIHKAKPSQKLIDEGAYQRNDGIWVYKKVNALDLWNKIMQSNYDFAEPGILFRDNMNNDNNLRYCETLDATNPCAEQPLPNYGCCDLGPIILPKFVNNPFEEIASFDYIAFKEAVTIQVRFLDNVLDATYWPLKQQKKESDSKRRIGVGFTGLANALAMLNIKYNSEEGLETSRLIAQAMRDTAYTASVNLAKEKGSFSLFNADKYLEEGTFASRLPDHIKEYIREFGIRNSHLLSIAPTGTVSLAFADNASNGIEPPYALAYTRKKRMVDGTSQIYFVVDHALRIYLSTIDLDFSNSILEAIVNYKDTFMYLGKETKVKSVIPTAFVTALELTTDEHVAMLRVVQPYIDTSISKTVNCPTSITFDDFKGIYDLAHDSKLKGISTYRPNTILGAVLSVEPGVNKPKEEVKDSIEVLLNSFIKKRPSGTLESKTRKVEYINSFVEDNFYVGLSFIDVAENVKRPIEVFFTVCPDGVSQEWLDSYAINLSLLARGGLEVFCKALRADRKVKSDKGQTRYGWYTKPDGSKVPKFHSSEVACMAFAIQEILIEENIIDINGFVLYQNTKKVEKETEAISVVRTVGKVCPECGAAAMIKVNSCDKCLECGHVGSCG